MAPQWRVVRRDYFSDVAVSSVSWGKSAFSGDFHRPVGSPRSRAAQRSQSVSYTSVPTKLTDRIQPHTNEYFAVYVSYKPPSNIKVGYKQS